MKTILITVFLILCHWDIFPQGFWQKTNGPYGGSVPYLTIDQYGYIYASTDDGAYRTLMSNDDWALVNPDIPYVWAFAFDSNGIYMYAHFGGQVDFGIHRSADNGQSWTRIMNGHYIYYVYNLAVTTKGTLLSATSDGIFRSTDHGDNWTYQGLAPISVWCFVNGQDQTIYAGTSQGLYYSTDDGINWVAPVNQGLTDRTLYSLISQENYFMAATGSGVFKSTNGGDNWYHVGLGWTNELTMTPNGRIFAATMGGGGVFKTEDQGKSWILCSNGLFGNRYMESIVSDQYGNLYVGSADKGGVFKSTNNGDSWFTFNQGLSSASVQSIYVHNDGTIFTGCYGSGIYSSSDGGNNWITSNCGLISGFTGDISKDTLGNILATSSYLYRSTNQGQSWHIMNDTMYYLHKILTTRYKSILITRSSRGVYRSADNGLTWNFLNNGLPNRPAIHDITEGYSGKIFIVSYGDGIYSSTNNGDQWVKSNTGITDNGLWSIQHEKEGYIFAGATSGIFRSVNNGVSWEFVAPIREVRDFVISKNGTIYCTSEFDGVFFSTDRGSSWHSLPGAIGISLGIDSANHLLLGTDGYGLYRSVNPIVSIDETSFEKPNCIELYQNYPNPFNPSTRISYYLPSQGIVNIYIYNSLGQQVRYLVKQQKNAGRYEVVWDGKNDSGNNVSSGLYFYRLVFGAQTKTKKMLLIR